MYDLSVIVPTLNERENIRPMLDRLDRALAEVSWEILFVDDDSTDGTAELVREIGRRRDNVRCLQRVGRRGLSSAAVEGMLAASARHIAVMDGDLQHDETKLPEMLDRLKRRDLDIVVATRFGDAASPPEIDAGRLRLSRLAAALSRVVVGPELSDPMSGFFVLNRDFLNATVHRLSLTGFKILVDLFASSPRKVRFEEVAFSFRRRASGASKADALVALELLVLLADKTIGRIVPIRFVQFFAVGSLGVVVHLMTLGLWFRLVGIEFVPAQITATFTAMTFNYFLNNAFTYRDQRLRGRRLIRGLASFLLICGLGALANLQVSRIIFDLGAPWAFAGLIGAGISAVWNYAVTATFTWTRQGRD